MSPFLRAILMKKNKSEEFKHLWLKSRGNRAPLIATIIARDILSIAFIFCGNIHHYPASCNRIGSSGVS